MKKKDEAKITPIEYIGGVMDEETRPLLKQYIETLNEGEGALVVFRLPEGVNSNILLESDIQHISGHDWNYVTGKGGNSSMQELVDNLSKRASELRVANHLFSQGKAKIKAFDNHTICFGIIGKNEGEIKSIKGIVHQQLNMGLNGDLLLHEGDIILQSLIENNVFLADKKTRPIHVKTYGAGGSAHKEVNPGVMAVSDGVIDIRTHVDPASTVEFLKKFCKEFSDKNPSKNLKELEAFYQQVKKIQDQIADEPGYTGITMVHDVAELARRASQYTKMDTVEIMKKMSPGDKRYYGEITFGTPSHGATMIHKLTHGEGGQPFMGNEGQEKLVKSLQSFFSQMSQVDHDKQKKIIDTMLHEKGQIESQISEKSKKIMELSRKHIKTEEIEKFKNLEERIKKLNETIEEDVEEILNANNDRQMIEKLEEYIKYNELQIEECRNTQRQLLDNAAKRLVDEDAITYYQLTQDINSLNEQSAKIEKEIVQTMNYFTQLNSADQMLKTCIESRKSIHEKHHSDSEFSITACGNLFFTEHDKKAVGHYGAKLVEMENQLFVEIINRAIANQLYVDREFITKIAADPLKIEDDVSRALNEWAKDHSMSVDDYVDAYMWAKKGQSFDDFPDSGRWTVAEKLYLKDEKCRTRFYNFGDEKNPKIINPFWKEIGTDLVTEIRDGKAFQGDAFIGLKLHEKPQSEEVNKLRDLATKILNNPNDEKIEENVRTLFTNYLKLMTPMHCGHDQYKVYARSIPVLKKGYVDQLSDWDQPIYKSTNTAVLDREAAKFVTLQGGKSIGGGVAVITTSIQKMNAEYMPANVALARMLKAEREIPADYSKIVEIGTSYLAQRRVSQKNVDDDLKDSIERIKTLVKKGTQILIDNDLIEGSEKNKTLVNKASQAMNKEKYIERVGFFSGTRPVYPGILVTYGVRQEKVTGPRVAEALNKIKQEAGKDVALDVAEKFLKWSASKHRNFNTRDIKEMVKGIKNEIEQESMMTMSKK